MFRLLLRQGFRLTQLEDAAHAPTIAAQPTLAVERERRPFLLLAAE